MIWGGCPLLFFMTFTAEESKKFTTIFKQHYKKLVCKARTILFSYDLAEDAVEEAFIRALNNLDKIMELNEPRRVAFLLCTLERIAYDTKHKNSRILQVALDSNELLTAGDDPIWEQVSAQESVRILKEILSELPQDDQDMLIYKVVYEWSNQEIADVMGISSNYVSVRLSRIRKKVMNKYHESEDGVR